MDQRCHRPLGEGGLWLLGPGHAAALSAMATRVLRRMSSLAPSV